MLGKAKKTTSIDSIGMDFIVKCVGDHGNLVYPLRRQRQKGIRDRSITPDKTAAINGAG